MCNELTPAEAHDFNLLYVDGNQRSRVKSYFTLFDSHYYLLNKYDDVDALTYITQNYDHDYWNSYGRDSLAFVTGGNFHPFPGKYILPN